MARVEDLGFRIRRSINESTAQTVSVRAGAARERARPIPADRDRTAGRRVGEQVGRYVLTAELGRGGMGHVLAAHDRDLDRLVAIKFITVADGGLAQFLSEARATARCVHPNIVAVHEIGEHDGAPYLVLEHLAGPSLAQLAREQRLPVPRVLTIMSAVARALECAHAQGIVHRDLKPSNILVLGDDSAKVLDFGIASFSPGLSSGPRRHVSGTLPYMAPEQLRGGDVDGRADVWAFGVVLFQLLAGVRPFREHPGQDLRDEVLDVDRPAPRITTHRPDLPAPLVEIVARCLEKRRERRYQSATELLASLDRLAGNCTACDLATWLETGPSPDQRDLVAVRLVRAVAKRPLGGSVDPARIRVWSDLRVEVGGGTGSVTAFHDIRAVASLAHQAIATAREARTPSQRRRARRMQQVLASVLRAKAPRRLSARQLAKQLASAHSPASYRGFLALVASLMVTALLALLVGIGWVRDRQPSDERPPERATLQQLERLEDQMARLQTAGDLPAAHALFDRFVAGPDGAELRATAWRRRSARELAVRELDSALTSAAASYLSARDEVEADGALAAALAVQLERRRWDEADRALAAIGATREPELVRASATVAIATRRARPPSLALSGAMAAATQLLAGTPEPEPVEHAEAIDLDADGRMEAVALAGGKLRAMRPDGVSLWETPWLGPTPGGATAAGDYLTCAARDARGAWFAAAGPTVARLFHVDASGATLVLETARFWGCALGDLDGDGAAELYVARGEDLVRYRAEPDGTWRSTRLALGSIVTGVVVADLDGDGRGELAVAAAEWMAYDVRVLAGPDLTMVDRIRLGRVTDLAALGRGPGQPAVLLARKESAWTSARYLPFDQLPGTPDGFYVLRLADGRLRITGHLAQAANGSHGAIRAADLDGDGREEGLVNEPSTYATVRTLVLALDDADGLACTTVEGVKAMTAGRFAGGPEHAVLAEVRDGSKVSRWWLGVGTTAVPSIAPGAPPVQPRVPPGLDAALAATWRRATTLGRIGATAGAIEGFEQLAATLPPAFQPIALAEVLALRVRRGEPVAAVYKAIAAKASPGSTSRFAATSGAVTAAIDEGDLATAVTIIDAALDDPQLAEPTRVQLQALRAHIEPHEITVFDGSALDARWEILDPIGVRRDPVARALVVDAFGSHPMAAIDLARSRGAIGLTLEATITRAEWAAGIRFVLRPSSPDGRPLVLRVGTAGGGGVYQLVAELNGYWVASWPHRAIDSSRTLRVQVTWLPDTDRVSWDVAIDGVHAGHVARRPAGSPEHWRLEIQGDYADRDAHATRMAMAITKLVVSGLEPVPVTRHDPMRAARLALANGDHDRVRALVRDRDDPDASLIAAVRALRDDEREPALAALRRVRRFAGTDGSTLRLLAHLMRVDDGAHAQAVSLAAGEARLAAVGLAWTRSALQHPDSILVQRQLTQNLGDVELQEPSALPLLLLRGAARAAIGELAEAEADLGALLARDALAVLPADARAATQLERARVAVRRGADHQAADALRAALAASPWPESVADLALLDPELAALAARHDLQQVFALGRPLASP